MVRLTWEHDNGKIEVSFDERELTIFSFANYLITFLRAIGYTNKSIADLFGFNNNEDVYFDER